MLPTPRFDGLNLTAFNFNMHYRKNERGDNWLIDYQAFYDDPAILMEDGAYVNIRGKQVTLVRGAAWAWYTGHEREQVEPGCIITVQP